MTYRKDTKKTDTRLHTHDTDTAKTTQAKEERHEASHTYDTDTARRTQSKERSSMTQGRDDTGTT